MLTGFVVSRRTACAFSILLLLLTSVQAQENSASRGRRAAADSGAEATITVNEQFLNSFLNGIFDNLNEPAMPLTVGGARSSAQCASEIRLKREVGGTRTAGRVDYIGAQPHTPALPRAGG